MAALEHVIEGGKIELANLGNLISILKYKSPR